MSKIIYTKTDEAPALATYSLLPIIKSFTASANIKVESKDISLAGRILANFSSYFSSSPPISDALVELGKWTQQEDANIIKLPNISASIPQLKAAIKELQKKGYSLPDYPENPSTDEEIQVKTRYDKIKGSAVNPVLREGNSDRRGPKSVKEYARNHPHYMGSWSSDSQSHVASMTQGDFYDSEQSLTIEKAKKVSILFKKKNGKVQILKNYFPLQSQEIIDSSVMRMSKLTEFLEKEIVDAKKQNILFSLHMKATMMKVSDPVIFGIAVKVYYKKLCETHGKLLNDLGVNFNNGIGDFYTKIQHLDKEKKQSLEELIQDIYKTNSALAMVNSDKGITNLHVPSDIIIDASMPAMIRSSGKMWNAKGQLQDTKAVIPDRCYAGIYQVVIDDCKAHGAYDPTTMGSVSNVGLMAQKAEEYGSHDKTFQLHEEGIVQIVDEYEKVLMQQSVDKGDIFRMCQTKDEPIQNWVKLAISRTKETRDPAVFWLDQDRAHDAQMIKKVNQYLQASNTENLDIRILTPVEATLLSVKRIRKGLNTISVTGNVLRDYLTDLFPILELGTSAKMLSIVPLIKGGGLFETGAGGSAPKHVQQFLEEGHLRWDSLGEFLALAASLDHLSTTQHNVKAKILSKTLEIASFKYLQENKSPSRKVKEIDNRGSHYYLTTYWAEALANQEEDQKLKEKFGNIAKQLIENEEKINEELLKVQGNPVSIGGYYLPDDSLTNDSMRPSPTFNQIIDSI